MPEIALALLEEAADVIVISEYRTTMGGQLRALLAEHGWEHQLCTEPARGKNGMLLASRFPLTPGASPTDPPVDGRWLHAVVSPTSEAWGAPNGACSTPLHVIGIHAPDGHGDRTLQTAYWRFLLDTTGALRDEHCVVIGDLNTGRHKADETGKTFRCTSLLGQFCTQGYTDAWRELHPQAREYTWFSHKGGGFRIDAAYLSRPLREKLQSARHAHQLRSAGTSDHAPIVVQIGSIASASEPQHAPRASQASS